MSRDRTYKPKTPTKKITTTQKEVDQVKDDARHAQSLLDNPYLKTYCNNVKHSILERHAKQDIFDSSEQSEQNGVKITTHFPAKKEYLLLAGEYRFIDRLLSDLRQTVAIGKDLDEKIKSEEIEISE